MTIDNNKNITGIVYNHLNLPTRVNVDGGAKYISYIYDATGAKLKKIVTDGSSSTTEYAGNYFYKNGTLEFFNHTEGIVEHEADGYKYVYQYKDHLNNVRLSYKDADKNGSISISEIVQEKNYYPFGLQHQGYNDMLRGRNHNYGFGDKEENKELDLEWLNFGARNYNSAIGRWMNIDNLAENSIDLTPYHYANNNPIIFVDPDGQDWFYYKQEGNEEATWNWHDGSEHTVQIGNIEGNALNITLQGVSSVVVFNGSRDEQKGAGNNINGDGAITADITVYGPGGADDVSTYTGYTLTSDADIRTPIDEGVYTGKRRAYAGSSALPKHYQLFENGADNIRTMDGVINANTPSQVRENGEGYKTEIFIHRTNNSGFCGGTVSTGCLLIAPGDWNNFNAQLSPLGNALDNEANSKTFTLILNRTGSDHNPSKAAPVETTQTIYNLNLGKR
ncbi:RHS repeat-associated core domain-containing protein [Aquimarina macrocephali]|uniref:RHS repeat-associated core domain-containing protein n=1 Tax=Aquimarina macrocephali TaxID=666563 RepID=UPI0004671B7D|nr:RHS repeat-associated core domain-containing protein [Aquimarina macrocephali]